MKSHLYHLQININFKNLTFYKELFQFLNWKVIFESDDGVIGFKSDVNGDIWFVNNQTKEDLDFDKKGLNHLAIKVEKSVEVDQVVAYMKRKKIEAQFNTPRHRPEFATDKEHTYYQVMFKSPDNIVFEIVYIGPKE